MTDQQAIVAVVIAVTTLALCGGATTCWLHIKLSEMRTECQHLQLRMAQTEAERRQFKRELETANRRLKSADAMLLAFQELADRLEEEMESRP